MSKWKSETLHIESKAQLQAHREHFWQAHSAAAGLAVHRQAFWNQVEKDAEAQVWRDADIDYEARKAALKAQLLSLSPSDLAGYFAEIGVAPQDINVWLAASPVA